MKDNEQRCLRYEVIDLVSEFMERGNSYNYVINALVGALADVFVSANPGSEKVGSMCDTLRDALAEEVHDRILGVTPMHGHA